MIDKYQNLEGKEENELEIHLLEEYLIWGMSQDLYFLKLSSSWPESMWLVSSLKPKMLYFYLRLHRNIYERRQGTIFGEIEVY